MGAPRRLIVNADDLGMSPGVDRGIAEAHDRGIVTSASLMVRRPDAAAAVRLAAARPRLSLGLHVELGEWAHREGGWVAASEIVAASDTVAVSREVDRQLRAFRELTGRWPTHIDSHQHVHRNEPARGILLDRAEDLDVPLRGCDDRVRHCGDFHGQTGTGEPFPQGIALERLLGILEGLLPGVTELGCHPGHPEDGDSPYGRERALEVRVLCDPRVRAAIVLEGIELCSFADLARSQPAEAHGGDV